ncbi:hypothetical protein LCGC14_0289460 [marine sediment metagenome]|uniref:Uncharacterized protein n=1 Tax=marine sediment metagenome TaxID=412755 RepID=A0A0F9TYU2_9ZZZZ
MPIRPAPKPSWKMLAALLMLAYLQMQTSPTGSIDSLKQGMDELEKMLRE